MIFKILVSDYCYLDEFKEVYLTIRQGIAVPLA